MSNGPHEASVRSVDLTRPVGLERVPLADLVRETIARLDGYAPERESIRLLTELAGRLERALETPQNRFSAAHLQELLGTYFFWCRDFGDTLDGEVFLELGAGAEAPVLLASAMVALGASRAYGLELTPPLSHADHARGIGRLLYWLLARPDLFDKFDLSPLRETIAANVALALYTRGVHADLRTAWEAAQALIDKGIRDWFTTMVATHQRIAGV
jgi:hypothetical protein